MSKEPKPQSETREERALTDVAVDQYSLKQRLAPITADVYKRLTDYRTERQQAANVSNTDFKMAAAQIPTANTPQAAVNRGLTLGTGGARQAVGTKITTDRAEVGTLAALAGKARGQQTQAIAGLGDLSIDSQSRAIENARIKAASQAQTGNTVAGLAGLTANTVFNDPSTNFLGMSRTGVKTSANMNPAAYPYK